MTPALRVCHVVSSFRPVIGGAERGTETLCEALRREGVDAVVLTRRYRADLPRAALVRGIPVRRLGIPGRGKLNALTFALEVILTLATRHRGYRIVHVQNLDTPMLAGFIARSVLRRQLMATIHGEAPILAARATRLGRRRLWGMTRLVDRISAINPENVRVLLEVGVPAERIVSIPNGIDLDRFHPPDAGVRAAARQRLGIDPDAVVVLYLGRLVPFKRVDLLLAAWPDVARAQAGCELLIVGTGPSEPDLRAQAASVSGPIRFEGPTDDAPSYLHAADVFVLPSGDHALQEYEGLSVALIEAMACGLTPVVTRGPGNDVLVPNDRFGLRFDIGDRAGLCDALSRAVSAPELRRTVGRAAHERVAERYSAAVVARQVRSVYAELAAR